MCVYILHWNHPEPVCQQIRPFRLYMFDYLVKYTGVLQQVSLCYFYMLLVHWFAGHGCKGLLPGLSLTLIIVAAHTYGLVSFEDGENICTVFNNFTLRCNYHSHIDR